MRLTAPALFSTTLHALLRHPARHLHRALWCATLVEAIAWVSLVPVLAGVFDALASRQPLRPGTIAPWLALALLSALLRRRATLAAYRGAAEIARAARDTLAHALPQYTLDWFEHGPGNRLGHLAGSAIDEAAGAVAHICPALYRRMVPALLFALALPLFNLPAAVLLGSLGALYWRAQRTLRRQATHDTRLRARHAATLNRRLLDFARLQPELRTAASVHSQAGPLHHAIDRDARLALASLRRNLPFNALESVALQGLWLGLLVVLLSQHLGGTLTLGECLALAVVGCRLLLPLQQLPPLIAAWQHSQRTLARIARLSCPVAEGRSPSGPAKQSTQSSPPERSPPSTQLAPSGGNLVPTRASSATRYAAPSLVLRQVSLRYGPRTVLHCASHTFDGPGLHVLAGPSGGGKSSLLRLLSGLCVPTGGEVAVCGQPLADLPPGTRRQLICLAPQQPWHAPAGIADNLRIARADASLDALWRATRDAAIDDVIAAHPLGWQAPLGQDDRLGGLGGSGFSGGERQRLALARVLLADTPVLLLDEPFAAVDGRLEGRLIATLRALAETHLIIVATHRLRIAGQARAVHLLPGDGTLISDRHATLLHRSALYARLWQAGAAHGFPGRGERG